MPYVIIAVLVVVIFILIYALANKKTKKDEPYKIKDTDKDFLIVKEKFMFQIELKVLSLLNKACESNFIALPKVNLGSLLSPNGSKLAYNAVADKVVDFVIFEKSTMKAVLIVDVYDNSFNDEALSEQDPSVTKLLSDLKLPIHAVLIKRAFDEQAFITEIKNIISPKPQPKENEQNAS